MAELPPQIANDLPDAPTGSEVREQIIESTKIRAEGDDKAEKGASAASEMSRMLRRLAEAMDANPNSWDTLLGRKR